MVLPEASRFLKEVPGDRQAGEVRVGDHQLAQVGEEAGYPADEGQFGLLVALRTLEEGRQLRGIVVREVGVGHGTAVDMIPFGAIAEVAGDQICDQVGLGTKLEPAR